MAMEVYTSGDWVVKAGKEDEFVKRWQEFAQWTDKNIEGSGDFYLIQDQQNPKHFLSFGSWTSPEVVSKWRQLPEFQAFLGKCKELCDDFKAGDYMLRVSSNN
jgi:quinol monooxygenase YgiN